MGMVTELSWLKTEKIWEQFKRFMGETLPGKSPLKELLIEEGNKESEGSNLASDLGWWKSEVIRIHEDSNVYLVPGRWCDLEQTASFFMYLIRIEYLVLELLCYLDTIFK